MDETGRSDAALVGIQRGFSSRASFISCAICLENSFPVVGDSGGHVLPYVEFLRGAMRHLEISSHHHHGRCGHDLVGLLFLSCQ